MKYIYIKLFFSLFLLLSSYSCQNEPWSFDDYKYSTTYFPYQTPVRTLVLGDYELVDNTKDNNGQFSIGIAIGGLYENNIDRKVDYFVDESLTNNLYTESGDTIVSLPQSYYTLSPVSTAIVPKGKMQGYINVQLNDAFFDDTISYKVHYVIPIVIKSSETDSILKGKSIKIDPDRRIASNWIYVPKDYTLFGIKYINPYHGNYLCRGKDIITNVNNEIVSEIVHRTLYVEKNEIILLKTTGRNQVVLTDKVRKLPNSPGNFKMKLDFDEIGNCRISQVSGSSYPISGTGKFIKNGDEWGGKKRNAIVLDYNITDAANNEIHHATDTLVIRDRDVRLETFKAVVK